MFTFPDSNATKLILAEARATVIIGSPDGSHTLMSLTITLFSSPKLMLPISTGALSCFDKTSAVQLAKAFCMNGKLKSSTMVA